MYQDVSELRKENAHLRLKVSELEANMCSLQYDKFQDQVGYHKHIGELKENINGKGFPVFFRVKFNNSFHRLAGFFARCCRDKVPTHESSE